MKNIPISSGTAPPSDWQKAVSLLLEARRTTLPNGLTSFVLPSARSRTAAIYLAVKTGSAGEGPWLGAGLSHLVEHMFFKGTGRRSKEQMETDVRRFGGYMNAYTSHDLTVFYLHVLAESLKPALEFVAEAAFEPLYGEAEFSKERQVILAEMQMDEDQISRKTYEELCAALFRVHPYRHPVIGYKPLFEALTADDLRRFFETHYVPNHMVLSVAGYLDAGETQGWIADAFGKAPIGHPPARPAFVEPPQTSARFRRLYRPAEHPRIMMGYPSVASAHPDSPAFDLLSEMLGGSRSSRFNQNLRESKRVALEASAFHHGMNDAGVFCGELVCRREDFDEARNALSDEIRSAGSAPWSDTEIRCAKNRILADHFEHLESHSELAHALIQSEVLGGDAAYLERYLRSLQELTGDAIGQIARKHLDPKYLTEVHLLPVSPVAGASKTRSESQPPVVQPIPAVPVFKVLDDPALPLTVHRHEPGAPLVHLYFAAKGGVLYEPSELQGVSSMLADLLIKGAGPYDQKAIAERVNSWGGGIEPFSGLNTFGLTLSLLKSYLPEALELLGQILGHLHLDAHEITKVRLEHTEALAAEGEEIYSYASRRMMEELFGSHPYARNALGKPETLKRITAEDLKRFYSERLRSKEWVLGFSGDADLPTFRQHWLHETKGLLLNDDAPHEPFLPAKWLPKSGAAGVAHHALPKEQAVVLDAYAAPDINNPVRHTALVLQTILNGSGGRLYRSIRDERSLAYVVGSSVSFGIAAGHMVWYAGCSPERSGEARTALTEEQTKLLRDGVTANEIEEAKIYLLGQWEQSRESSESSLRDAVFAVLMGNGVESCLRYPEAIRSVTQESILRFIKDHFSEGPRARLTVGPDASKRPSTP